MKKILAFIFILTVGYSFAQEIPTTTPRTIEPVPKTTTGGSMLFPEKKETKTYTRPKKNNEINMRQETDLVDPGIKFKNQKFRSDTPSNNLKSDSYLGEIKTGLKLVRLVARDPLYEDGDLIRIWMDDKVVVKEMYLRNSYQGVLLPLKDGFNKIEVEAINQGTSGLNTMQFRVMDVKGNVVDDYFWRLASGVRTTIILLKEPTLENNESGN